MSFIFDVADDSRPLVLVFLEYKLSYDITVLLSWEPGAFYLPRKA